MPSHDSCRFPKRQFRIDQSVDYGKRPGWQIRTESCSFDEHNEQEEGRYRGFHGRISEGNPCPAITAMPTEEEPSQNGHVIVPADRMAAAGTMGAGETEAHSGRKPINDHVEKASHAAADSRHPDCSNPNEGCLVHTSR